MKITLGRRGKAKLDPFLVGADGRTPRYAMYKKHFGGQVLEFREMVIEMHLMKNPMKMSLKSSVMQGIWLGMHPKTGGHSIAVLEGGLVMRVRTILRRPDSEKWNLKELTKITAAPKRPKSEE